MPPDHASLTEAAKLAEKSGDLERAFQIWSEVSSQSNDAIHFCQLGRVARKLRKWTEAESAFSRAVEIAPNLSIVLEAYGGLFLRRTDGDRHKNLELARDWFLRALQCERNARLLSRLGAAYTFLGDMNAAMRAFSEAIELDEKYEEAYFNLAVLTKETNPEKAKELLERAIELDPNYLKAHQDLGILFQTSGDPVKAEYQFRRCIEIDPKDYWSHLYLANSLAVQGNSDDEAEKEFRAAIALQPSNPAGYRFFANFLDSHSRSEEAAQVRQRPLN